MPFSSTAPGAETSPFKQGGRTGSGQSTADPQDFARNQAATLVQEDLRGQNPAIPLMEMQAQQAKTREIMDAMGGADTATKLMRLYSGGLHQKVTDTGAAVSSAIKNMSGTLRENAGKLVNKFLYQSRASKAGTQEQGGEKTPGWVDFATGAIQGIGAGMNLGAGMGGTPDATTQALNTKTGTSWDKLPIKTGSFPESPDPVKYKYSPYW